MEFAGNQEGKVIRVPQLKRGKEDVAVSERVSTHYICTPAHCGIGPHIWLIPHISRSQSFCLLLVGFCKI
jgi:hypothetical protein